ncbi:DUF255 domain-containing protein [bacterium]|nr:DUF255 domain-containing protein [bacterium]
MKPHSSSHDPERKSIPWRDWSEAAFAAAQRSKRPILLYLVTQWGHAIHVYDRSVLSDPGVIDQINENFVPIRVDSIRRPDVFERYNQGGWPSICILTPDGVLLHGRTGGTRDILLETLKQVKEYFTENFDAIEAAVKEQGELALPTMRNLPEGEGGSISLDSIRQDALAYYDTRYHGFGRAPKFAMPDLLFFLLEDPSEELRRLAFVTLETLRVSPMHDQLGGGFHRSCEDEAWRFPTFEKLFSDNIAILECYLEAYRQTRDERFSTVAMRLMGYIEDALGDESGLFYNAQDSDPEPGNRNGFYGWTADEIKEAVDDENAAAVAIAYYGIGPESKLPGVDGRSALEERVPVSQLALRFDAEAEQIESLLEKAKLAIQKVRAARKDPGVDDGMLLSDQGRAMGALALAGILLGKPRFMQRAFEIGDLIWSRAHLETGCVPREFGSTDESIYLIDQVDVMLGYLDLYRVSGRSNDLVRAVTLAEETWELLGDPEGGGCLDHLQRETELGAVRYPYTPFEPNSRLLLATLLISAYTQDSNWHQRALQLKDGLETMRPAHRLRDASYGRALRRVITTPPMVDLITGDGVGEMRKRLLEEAPIGTLIRAFDPDQRTPWTPLERYPSNGANARAVVYAGETSFEPTHDIELALLHLNELT